MQVHEPGGVTRLGIYCKHSIIKRPGFLAVNVALAQSPHSLKDRVNAAEWQACVDLAACCRLVAQHGWDDLIFTHILAKVPCTEDFLINPFGLSFLADVAKSAQGMGGALAWPALLRKLDKLDPGYKH